MEKKILKQLLRKLGLSGQPVKYSGKAVTWLTKNTNEYLTSVGNYGTIVKAFGFRKKGGVITDISWKAGGNSYESSGPSVAITESFDYVVEIVNYFPRGGGGITIYQQ